MSVRAIKDCVGESGAVDSEARVPCPPDDPDQRRRERGGGTGSLTLRAGTSPAGGSGDPDQAITPLRYERIPGSEDSFPTPSP